MATGSSVISVNIIGDAKKLIGALGKADKATGGLLGSATKLAGGFLAVEKGAELVSGFVADSIDEFDRLGDATTNLTIQLGPFAERMIDSAEGLERLGLSKQDVIELEARLADLLTTAGVADNTIAFLGEQAVATAAAMALLGDADQSTILDQIGKAAGGGAKAAKELGVTLIDTKDAGAQLNNILTQLKPKLDSATTGTMDLEQQQAFMQARVETLQAKLGEQLNPILLDFWEGLTLAADAMGGIPEDLKQIEDAARTILAPLGNLNDILGGIGDFFGQKHSTTLSVNIDSNLSDSATAAALLRQQQRNGDLGRP